MPPTFTYTAPESRYVGTLANLIARSGDPQAQAAVDAARASGQADIARGNAWAGAAHDVAAIPGQIAQAKNEAMRTSLLQSEVQQRQQAVQAQQKAQAGQALVGQLVKQHGDDYEAVAKGLTEAGFVDAASKYRKDAVDTLEDRQKIAGLKRQTDAALAASVGKAANDSSSPDDFLGKLDHFVLGGQVSPDDRTKFVQSLQQAGPDGFDAWKKRTIDWADSVVAPTKVTKDEKLLKGVSGAEIVNNVTPPAPSKARFAAIANDPTKTPEERASAKQSLADMETPAHLEAREGFVIKGTTNVPNYNPSTGAWSFNGQQVAADQIQRAAPPKDPIAAALANVSLQTARLNLDDKKRRDANIDALAEGVKAGTIPPDPEGLGRQGLYGEVVAKLQKDGVNFNVLRQQYMAQKRLINTENSPQGVRLDIAVRSGLAMYDKVDQLSTQWDGLGIGLLSRANLKAALEGYKGPAAAKVAHELEGQIAQLTSDVATVEQNGMTPTNEARDVAKQGLEAWWGDGTIKAMTAQGRANMRIRDTARKETVPIVPGQTPLAAVPDAVTKALKGATPGIHTLSDGSKWQLGADGAVTKVP